MRDYAKVLAALNEDLNKAHSEDESPSRRFAIEALRSSFFKKLAPDGVSETAAKNALEKFERLNAAISDTFEWPDLSDDGQRFWMYLKRVFQEAVVVPLFEEPIEGVPSPKLVGGIAKILSRIEIGPGASRGVNSESFYTKLFEGHLSGTHPWLLALYRAAIMESGFWANAERHRSARFGFRLVDGNKLFFVEKSTYPVEIARTCCTEPLLNMVLQKGIGRWIENDCLLRSFGISLATQPSFNQALARKGSIDGSFGTIDLESASDSMSWSLIQQLAPPALRGLLSVTRCEYTIFPDGRRERLRMISTMGNGFTFPLQTLLFASVVRAVSYMRGYACSKPDEHFGVFGDDIIVRREIYDEVCSRLTQLGFRVNAGKSFNDGPFRESCGADYYLGTNVRGIYIKSLKHISDVYSAVNRLNRWSARHRVALPLTIGALLDGIRVRPIPFRDADDEGIKVTEDVARSFGASSRNYRALVRRTRQKRVPESSLEARNLGYRDYNCDGWVAAFLGGFARGAHTPVDPENPRLENLRARNRGLWLTPRSREQEIAFKVVRRSVPWWDWTGLHAIDEGVSYCDWEFAISGNLSLTA